MRLTSQPLSFGSRMDGDESPGSTGQRRKAQNRCPWSLSPKCDLRQNRPLWDIPNHGLAGSHTPPHTCLAYIFPAENGVSLPTSSQGYKPSIALAWAWALRLLPRTAFEGPAERGTGWSVFSPHVETALPPMLISGSGCYGEQRERGPLKIHRGTPGWTPAAGDQTESRSRGRGGALICYLRRGFPCPYLMTPQPPAPLRPGPAHWGRDVPRVTPAPASPPRPEDHRGP